MLKFFASPWAVVGVLLFGTAGGREVLRKASKEAIKAGLVLSDKTKELVAEVKEETTDLMAEIKHEQAERNNSHSKTH